jgi:hypothetical protein
VHKRQADPPPLKTPKHVDRAELANES